MTQKNKLPKDWKIVELKEVVSLLGDGLHGTPKYTNESDYYFINGNNLGNGKITIKENTKKVSIEEYQKYKKLLNDKTVLVSINGTLGNVAFYNNEKVILGKSACYFNVLDCLDKQYIKIILSGLEFLNYAHKSATGSTIPNVSLKTMREFKFPLPPLETQHAIVSKIEELFSELDKGIEDLKTSQQQLKTYRQSVLKWGFDGKLTNKKVKEGELPKGWDWKKIKDICEIKGGKNQSKVINPEGKYPIYGSSGIFGYADEFICNENTTIVGRKGNINSPLYVTTKFWNVDTAFGLCTNENYESKLLFYFCLSFNFKKLDKSTTIPSLAKSDILSIDIPLPPLEQQQKIVQEIESRLSVADKMEESISQSLQQAEALRQSILKKAFSGELV
jgi:type I restriction enzyme S subunit